MTERAVKAYIRKCVDKRICDELSQLRKDLKLPPPGRRLLNLREAVEYKGGSFNTIKDRPKRQPKGGKADVYLMGTKHWRANTVIQWADIADHNLATYLNACENDFIDEIAF